MVVLAILFILSIIAAWLLWHYRKVHKTSFVRFLARFGSVLLWTYALLLLGSMFYQQEWMSIRLARETVPAWAAAPIVWGYWGGWSWLNLGDWIYGRRGRT